MSSFNRYMTDCQNRSTAGPIEASIGRFSSFFKDMRKLLILPNPLAVDCCLFLKLSQTSLADAALKLWFKGCLLTTGSSFMLRLVRLSWNLPMISFSEERHVLLSKPPPARYLMQDSGILVILLAGCSSSMRQGSYSGRGAWRSTNCLRMPPGLVDSSSGPSLPSTISWLFFTENLGLLSISLSMSYLFPNARWPRGASSDSSGAAGPIFYGLGWGVTAGGACSSGGCSWSMLLAYFLMASASIWQSWLRANFFWCVAGLGLLGRKSRGQAVCFRRIGDSIIQTTNNFIKHQTLYQNIVLFMKVNSFRWTSNTLSIQNISNQLIDFSKLKQYF